MKLHVTDNIEIRQYVREGLKKNEGYCPCVLNSKGQEKYKCICEDFRFNKKVGETCFCGLYIKDEQ